MLFWVIIFVVLIGIAKVWYELNYARLKGKSGERFIAGKLSRLDPNRYKVLNDLLIPSCGNSAMTQIDHVVVSNYGIFCIETKDYDGWIFGDAKQEYWTRVIYRYKDRIRNPMWQNYGHIKAIQDLVQVINPNILIIPFVVFPSTDKLKISGTDCVGRGRDLIDKIESFKQVVITDIERDKIVSIIENANIKDEEVRKQHIRDVKALKNN